MRSCPAPHARADGQRAAVEDSGPPLTNKEVLDMLHMGFSQDVLVEKTLEAVDIPVLTFLLPAWKKYREIVEFMDLEKHPANEVNLVSLAQHRVKVEHHPYLQVTYRGVEIPKAKLEFALTGDLTLEGVILKIQNGKIKAIQGGAMKWSGELLLENRSVLKKESKSYALTGKVDLGEGIPL